MKHTFNKILTYIPSFVQRHKTLLLGSATLCLILYSSESAASALETQLDKINTLAQGKMLKVGLGVGTVIGATMAIVKGSVALAGAIIGIAIALSYFLGWVQSANFIQTV